MLPEVVPLCLMASSDCLEGKTRTMISRDSQMMMSMWPQIMPTQYGPSIRRPFGHAFPIFSVSKRPGGCWKRNTAYTFSSDLRVSL